MIRQLLIKFYDWLGIKLEIPVHVCPPIPEHICPVIPDNVLIIDPAIFDVLPELMIWIEQQESCNDNVSGEYKRHQVYAKALKQYPDMKEIDLSLAIEIGIQKIKGGNHG